MRGHYTIYFSINLLAQGTTRSLSTYSDRRTDTHRKRDAVFSNNAQNSEFVERPDKKCGCILKYYK